MNREKWTPKVTYIPFADGEGGGKRGRGKERGWVGGKKKPHGKKNLPPSTWEKPRFTSPPSIHPLAYIMAAAACFPFVVWHSQPAPVPGLPCTTEQILHRAEHSREQKRREQSRRGID